MIMKKFQYTLLAMILSAGTFLFALTVWPLPKIELGELRGFFTVATAVEALLMGIGIAFVVYVLREHRMAIKSWRGLDWATFVSIAWILISGFPHDSQHLTHGADLRGLVSIEMLFHGSLAIAALVVMWQFVKNLDKK